MSHTLTDCACEAAGTTGSDECSAAGQCSCKSNVTGLQCSQCVDGHWNLTADNEQGCQGELLRMVVKNIYTDSIYTVKKSCSKKPAYNLLKIISYKVPEYKSMSVTSDCLGCAVLLCLVCLFDLACFFLSFFSSLIKNM